VKARVVWKACAEGHWARGEDIVSMNKLLEPEEIEHLIDSGDGSDYPGPSLLPGGGCNRWTRDNMPHFNSNYTCGTNPINYKIISVQQVKHKIIRREP